MRHLALILAAASLAATGCGVGNYTHEPDYVPGSAALKSFTAAGVGVLPIDDQRPPASRDPGNSTLGCIFLGALYPNSAHVEHIESSSCDTLTSYNSSTQEELAKRTPLIFLRDDLIKELTKANVLGPAKAVDSPDAAPFTLKAVLKSSSIDARMYCLTPMDTTWIFWFLGIPYASYDFHLVMDLTLSGPDGKALWTRTIDAKSGGVTGMYYDTGVTGENNLIKIYGDLLSSQMAEAGADLQAKLGGARPDVWRRANEFAAARATAQAAAAQGETDGAAAAPAAAGPSAPWWK